MAASRSGGQVDDDRLVGVAGKDLPAVGDAPAAIADVAVAGPGRASGDSPRLLSWPGKSRFRSPWLVGHLAQRLRHKGFHGQRFASCLDLGASSQSPCAFEVQCILHRLAERLDSARTRRDERSRAASRPDRVLVELDALLGHAAKDHRAQPPIAHGQGLDPLRRGFLDTEASMALAAAWFHPSPLLLLCGGLDRSTDRVNRPRYASGFAANFGCYWPFVLKNSLRLLSMVFCLLCECGENAGVGDVQGLDIHR